MKSIRICMLAMALDLSSGVASGQNAPATTEARTFFRTGLKLAQSGELQGALEAFQHAYDTSPNYAVLYNLGRAYEALGRSVEAVHTLEQFLRDGGDKIDASRREEVEAIVARLRTGLGRAEIDVTPQDAEVFLDGMRLGTGASSPRDLPAGEHVVAARLDGHLPRFETFTLAGGELGRVSIVLLPEPQVMPVSTPPAPGPLAHSVPPPVVDTSSRRGWALGVGIGGVALAGAAIATFAWNGGRYEDWKEDRARFEAELAGGATGSSVSSAAGDLRERAVAIQRTDDLALGMAVTAGCALVTSGVLWLTTLGQPKAHRASAHGQR